MANYDSGRYGYYGGEGLQHGEQRAAQLLMLQLPTVFAQIAATATTFLSIR